MAAVSHDDLVADGAVAVLRAQEEARQNSGQNHHKGDKGEGIAVQRDLLLEFEIVAVV